MTRITSLKNSFNTWENRKRSRAKGITFLVISLVLLAALIWAGQFGWRLWQGARPAILPPAQDIVVKLATKDAQGNAATEQAVMPLRLPAGFTISIFAKDLEGPRVLVQDSSGTLLVSLTKAGKVVALPDKEGNGKSEEEVTVVAGLNEPHGLAFQPNNGRRLYVAATDELVAFDYDSHHRSVSNPKQIVQLPPKGRHFTRSLLFTPAPQERLLLSVGSSCDVCEEKDWRYGKILQVNLQNGELKPFASGLRNAVFMALEPGSRAYLGYGDGPGLSRR